MREAEDVHYAIMDMERRIRIDEHEADRAGMSASKTDNLCLAIKALRKMQAKPLVIDQGMLMCPVCGYHPDYTMPYCERCGQKLQD